MKKSLFLICLLLAGGIGQVNASLGFWTDISKETAKSRGEQIIQVVNARYLELDLQGIRAALLTAPMERTSAQPLELILPMPDGTQQRFAIVESPVMAPGLSEKYPDIHTWSGQGITDPTATIRLDITQWGFHAMVLSALGSVFIDPLNLNVTNTYLCYYKSDAINRMQREACGYNPDALENVESAFATHLAKSAHAGNSAGSVNRSAGQSLRTYRLALAATGEYSAFYGGTVPGALAGMVASINRVNGVYEREMAIRMVLIPNTDTLIFTNATTDPYTNNNGGTMLSQNQTTVTARIGGSNYDFGHVFSTGGGGIAGLGVICSSSQKAKGVTGSPAPVNDPFDIDYVAHEMGHQFGGNHTFNGNTGSCSGNGNTATAFEPGSGTTIMAYAGICPAQNTANNSDAFFHTASFDEIQDYTTLSNGSNCPVTTATGNTAPVISSIGSDHAIPYLTPFQLTGAASDPDGDTLTYCWEEYDLGPAGSPNTPTLNAPLFRCQIPSLYNYRYFPKISTIVSNLTSLGGERLPAYARTMLFRLTARDNRNGGGGVTYEDVIITLDVINTGAPFAVTQPNTNLSWPAASQQNITWNVVGTDQPPINAANVDIFLSVDSGFTYPYTLATGVPNNGLATVNLPNIQTTKARVRVQGAGNVFFDISNTNFTISAPQGLSDLLQNQSVDVYPNPSVDVFNMSWAGDFRGDANLQVTDMAGRVVYAKKIFKNQAGLLFPMSLESFENGVYYVRLLTNEGMIVRKIVKE
ncbi:zinc-dependent metalloprotease family protein [soil metagenome]